MQCLNIKNKEVAALLDEYTNILGNYDAAYYVLSENNGYGLDKAPNGEPSKLYNFLVDSGYDNISTIKKIVDIKYNSKSVSKGKVFNANDINDDVIYNQLKAAFHGKTFYYDKRTNSQGTTVWLNKLKKFKSKNYNGTFLFKNKEDFDYAREILTKKLGSNKFFDDYNGEIVKEANNSYKIYLYKPLIESINPSLNEDYINYLDSKDYRDSIIPPFEDYDTIFNSPVSDVTEEATGSDKTLVSRLFDNKSKTTAREILARIKNKKNI